MIRKIFFIIALINIATSGFSAVIKLYPEATVVGRQVRLGEIAEVVAEEGENSDVLKRISLFPIPKKTVTIDGIEIKKRLSKRIRKNFVVMGRQVILKPLYTKIVEQEILERIKSETVRHYPYISFDNIKVLLLQPLKPIRVPYGDIRFRVIVPGGRFGLTKVARLEVRLNNKLYVSRTLMIRLMAYMRIMVAKRYIRKNEKLTASKIRFCRKPISKNPEKYIKSIYSRGGRLKFSCPVPKGRPILHRHLKK